MTMAEQESRWQEINRRFGHYIKLGVLLLLLLILSGVLDSVAGLVQERKTRRDAAVDEIGRSWGGAQVVTGPLLLLPYRYRLPARAYRDGVVQTIPGETRTGIIYVLPETLKIEGALTPVERYRGIFRAILYGANLRLSGTFVRPDLAALDVRAEDVLWQDATVIVGVSDLRGAASEPALDWGGKRIGFLPGPKGDFLSSGLHAPVGFGDAASPGESAAFAFTLEFDGSQNLAIVPVGKTTTVALRSTWPHPSFAGAYLPRTRSISASGFSAEWAISYLGRNYPQAWKSPDGDGDAVGAGDLRKRVTASQFGVSLLSPVDLYAMSERSVKYGMLFVVLILATIFAYEMFGRRRIHVLQYALTGFALCVFFLLLLALSEVIAFSLAYAIAASMSTALVALYVGKAMASTKRGLVIGGLLGGVYGYLYVVLQREDYALLSGALGVFVALAAVMYATRNIDWYASQQKQADLPAESAR
jgi:inner membrane protein